MFCGRERQQQLDELSKELSRVQDEADMLRLKMQSLHKKANSKVSVSEPVRRSNTTCDCPS